MKHTLLQIFYKFVIFFPLRMFNVVSVSFDAIISNGFLVEFLLFILYLLYLQMPDLVCLHLGFNVVH